MAKEMKKEYSPFKKKLLAKLGKKNSKSSENTNSTKNMDSKDNANNNGMTKENERVNIVEATAFPSHVSNIK